EPVDVLELARVVGLPVLTPRATRGERLGTGVLDRLAGPRILRQGETEQRDGLPALRASHTEAIHCAPRGSPSQVGCGPPVRLAHTARTSHETHATLEPPVYT